MINFETIRFIEMLNELSDLYRKGVLPFSDATEQNQYDYLFYDDSSEEIDEHGLCRYRLVYEAIIDQDHHDIECYYGKPGVFNVRLCIADDVDLDEIYGAIEISLLTENYLFVIDEDGWRSEE